MEFMLQNSITHIQNNFTIIEHKQPRKYYKAIQYFVKPRNDEWIVIKVGNKRPSRVYRDKIEALTYAKYQAIKREAVIYYYDNKLRVFDGLRELNDINEIVNIQFKITTKKYY